MNPTTYDRIRALIDADKSVDATQRQAIEQIIAPVRQPVSEQLLLTQQQAARALSVSRVTIWRMVRDGTIRPIEIRPGVLRYRYVDLVHLASGEAVTKCQN